MLSKLPASEYWKSDYTLYLLNIVLYINYSLPGVFESNVYPHAVNGSLWSLPVEFVMYALTPLALAVPAIRRRPGFLFAAGGALVLFAVWKTQIARPAEQIVFYNIDVMAGLSLAPYFVVGLVIAAADLGRRLNVYAGFLALFALAMVDASAPIKETLLIFVLPYSVLAFGAGPSLRLIPKGLDLSYGIFLWGFPVQQIISQLFHGSVNPWMLFVIATAISASVAALSWTFVEKPFLQLKPSKRLRPSHASGFDIMRGEEEMPETSPP